MLKKNKSMFLIIGIAVLTILIGSSFAYFAVNFQKNEEENNTNLNTELLSDTVLISNVDDSAGSFLVSDIYPGHKEVASIKVNVTGKKDSKIGVKFIYDVEENGLGDNIKISIYKSNKKIETNENYFNCVKKVDTAIEPTKYYEECEERDLELLIGEKVLAGGKEELEIVTDTIYVNDENQAEEYYYYAVVEFLNIETSQNEVMSKVLKGTIQVEAAPPERKTFESSVVSYGKLGNNIADSMLYSSYLDTENLLYDETVDNNLRYVGSNPNNYVRFNDELWRIIGVMDNVEDANGNKESKIKLMRNETIGSFSWYTTTSGNSRLGVNEWSLAHIMKLMNPGYEEENIGGSLYWNRTSGKCYNNHSGGTTNCNFTTSGLQDLSKKMIEKINWHIGSNGTVKKYDDILTKEFYELERSANTGKICTSGSYCNDNVARTTEWKGYIGLMYPSDYGFATSGNTITSRESCLNTKLYDWNNLEGCYQNNWFLKSGYSIWTMTAAGRDGYANNIFSLNQEDNRHGQIAPRYASMADNASATYPSLYLKSNIQIIDGMGTQENPYVLSYQES